MPAVHDDGGLTHSYVVAETVSLLHRRLGKRSAAALVHELLPVLELEHVDSELHREGMTAFLASARPRVSFVDAVSFTLMRREGIRTAFAFDRDFRREGFALLS